MGSANTGESGVTRRDRFGHWQTRHPWATGVAAAMVFLLGQLGVPALRDGISTIAVVVAVPISALFGLGMVGAQRRSPIVRHDLDLQQWSALSGAYRSARRGEPVQLTPDLQRLAFQEAQQQHRDSRPLRWALIALGIMLLLIGATLLWLQLQFGPESGGWFAVVLCILTGPLMIGLALHIPRATARTVQNLRRPDDVDTPDAAPHAG